jgi:hypothetical protein
MAGSVLSRTSLLSPPTKVPCDWPPARQFCEFPLLSADVFRVQPCAMVPPGVVYGVDPRMLAEVPPNWKSSFVVKFKRRT